MSRRRQLRRRRIFVAVVALLIVSALILLFWPSNPGPARPSHPLAARSTNHGTTTGLTTETQQLDVVDASRPLISNGLTLSPSRSLPTEIVHPTSTAHTYPLVVFVHGYDTSPSTFQRFISTLASEGFVVAAPSFPLEDPTRGNGLNRADLPNEATDVGYVITSILESPFASQLTPHEIGVVGHSDGADVALEVGYQQGLADPRIVASVASAPDPIAAPVTNGGPPLLLIHGSADSIVDPSSSAQVMNAVHAQTWSLTLEGADHTSAIWGPSQWTFSFDQAINDFLHATLIAHSTTTLTSELSLLPLASVQYRTGP
jgi:dienelactone hydrolase